MGPALTDEEDDEENNQCCASCDSEIIWEEDVVLAQVVYPFSSDGEMVDSLELYTTEEGEPVHLPLFYCFSCFENLIGSLNLLNKDRLPISSDEAPVVCDYCYSGIFIQETCVRFDHGELVISKRTNIPKFVEAVSNKPLIMCLGCTVQLNGSLDEEGETTYAELWPDISNDAECPHCTLDRCWRKDQCGCRCHMES